MNMVKKLRKALRVEAEQYDKKSLLRAIYTESVTRLPAFRLHPTEMVLAGLVTNQCSAHFWIRWQLFRCRVWFSCVSACLFHFLFYFVFWFPSSFNHFLNLHLRNRLTGWKSKTYYLKHRSERKEGTGKCWEIKSLLCLYFRSTCLHLSTPALWRPSLHASFPNTTNNLTLPTITLCHSL